MTKPLNRQQVQTLAKKLGYTLTFDVEWQQYRLCPKGKPESQAYYTDDLADAYGTLLCMEGMAVAMGGKL